MQEQAFFFNNRTGDQLFGYQHSVDNPTNVGVVFCHPFGEEKYRSYRSLVNFSRYLAARGIPSFRFDMKGTGDSDGELIQATIESQIEDTMDAITLFLEKTGISRLVLIGLRLGATIAALTAENDKRIDALVLLSPIIRGENYWRELLRTKQFASISYNQPAAKVSELMQQLELDGSLEIEAQLLNSDYIAQLRKINLLEQNLNFNGHILITGLSKDSQSQLLTSNLGEHYKNTSDTTQVWNQEERDYWSILSLYDQYFPQKTYQYTYNWLVQQRMGN